VTTVAKPVPEITPAMEPFWAAARERRLVVQRCTQCGTLRFPARPRCSACLHAGAEWVPVSGRGDIFSYVVVHQAAHPGFAAVAPYAVVVVQLAEGVRMLSGVTGIGPHELRVGMPVEVTFEARGPDVLLPMFRPIAT
jgi:uncharacterized OB-fold protein